jgi:hypothetical protein
MFFMRLVGGIAAGFSTSVSGVTALVAKYLERDGASIGMNVSGTASWLSAKISANLMHYGHKWDAYSSQTSSAIVAIAGQQQGLLTTASQADEFTMLLNDVGSSTDNRLPSGTYVVLNPDALMLKIFVPGGSDLLAWTSATRATFEYVSGVTGRISIAVRGSVTNANGNLAVLMPGHEESWNAGDIWNSEFLDFYRNSGFKMIRCMDMLNTMWRLDDEWSTRSLPGKITWHPRTSGNSQAIVPWEHLIDLATRLDLPLMINIPSRASVDYVTRLAELFKQQYPATLQLFNEGVGNEIWNTGGGFQNQTRWIEYLNHTRFVGDLDNTTGIVTFAGHGLSTSDHIFAFQDTSDWGLSANEKTDNHWFGASRGEDLIVDVLDADTFKMRYWPSTETPKPLLTFATFAKKTVTFIKGAEAGKFADMDGNYSRLCMRNWAIFDAAIGRDRCVHVLASQAVNASTTTARLAVTGARAATDVVAIAPYFSAPVHGIKLTPVAGGVTPSVWAFVTGGQSKSDAYAAIFPFGVTPTVAQIKAAGVSSLLQFPFSGATYAPMPTISAMDGAQVAVWVTTKIGTKDIVLSGTVTVGAAQAALEVQPTFAEYSDCLREYVTLSVSSIIKAQVAAASPVPLMNYECGNHTDAKAPGALMSWHNAYMKSPEYADVIKQYLAHMSQWIKVAGWFADVGVAGADTTCWTVATSYRTSAWATDYRYNALKNLGGYVARALPLQIEGLGAVPEILANPGGNYKIMTLPTDAAHYIHGGNVNGAFYIQNNEIYLDTSKADWSKPTSTPLVVHAIASSGQIGRAIISVPTGDSWYPGHSLFAWSTISDTDTAAVTPEIGGVAAKISTTPAAYAGGLWDMDNAAYSGSALTKNLDPTKPMLIAAVLDKDNTAVNTSYINALLSVGGGQGVSFQINASPSDMRAYVAASTGTKGVVFPSPSAGAHVYWLYTDGISTIQCGVDQVNGAASEAMNLAGAGLMGSSVVIGSNASAPRSLMKHGSMMVLNVDGLTLAQAKDRVAKMQALHGIA